MDDPAEEHEPKDGSETKLNDRNQEPALNQLPQARNEEAANRRDDVAGRALSCHEKTVVRLDRPTRGFPGRKARP